MRPSDFSPLYRSTIGFERLADMMNQATRVEPLNSWPPYDIEKLSDDDYRITMAVAGYSPDEIELVQQASTLAVIGKTQPAEDKAEFLYRGISRQSFTQTFHLADHVRVTSATLDAGLLTIALKREVPEALKPRKIEIGGASAQAATAEQRQSGRKPAASTPSKAA